MGVVVPVKRLALAKTRLAAYGGAARARSWRSPSPPTSSRRRCAAPSWAGARGDRRPARPTRLLRALGATVVADEPDAGLNPALAHGAELLRAERPGCGVATVSADLPALRPDGPRRGAARGAGRRPRPSSPTPTAAARRCWRPARAPSCAPAYGGGSRGRHLRLRGRRAGRRRPALRRDVDTPEDLRRALALGARPAHGGGRSPRLSVTAVHRHGARWAGEHRAAGHRDRARDRRAVVRRAVRAAADRRAASTAAGGPLPQPRAVLARLQRAGAGAGRGPRGAAARAGEVPGDLRQQPRRVLHGPGRRAQAPPEHGPRRPQRRRARPSASSSTRIAARAQELVAPSTPAVHASDVRPALDERRHPASCTGRTCRPSSRSRCTTTSARRCSRC